MSSFGRPSLDGPGWPAPDEADEPVYAPHAGGPRPRAVIRASDADREATATELRHHYATGRLDNDELAERLAAAYAARTHGSLDKLFTDLPGRHRSRRAPTAVPVRQDLYHHRLRHCRRPTMVMVCGVALVLLSSVSGGNVRGPGFALGAFLLILGCWCLFARLALWSLEQVSRVAYRAGVYRGRHRVDW